MRMTSIRSIMPATSSSSYCSLVNRSICTVTAVYGFFELNMMMTQSITYGMLYTLFFDAISLKCQPAGPSP